MDHYLCFVEMKSPLLNYGKNYKSKIFVVLLDGLTKYTQWDVYKIIGNLTSSLPGRMPYGVLEQFGIALEPAGLIT